MVSSMHRILRAVDAVPEFHYRVKGDEIVRLVTIHCGPTIGRKDGTFGFGFMEFYRDRTEFTEHALQEMSRVQALEGLCLEDATERIDCIYYSAVPWLAFTEMKHPHFMGDNHAVPRISTGKLIADRDRLLLPVSLDIHHGIADGYHASLFYGMLEDQEF